MSEAQGENNNTKEKNSELKLCF